MTKKKRILIVDDDIASTRLLKLNLEQANAYEVRVENWPEEALATARDFQPHLIILDVMMPRIFGGDIAARFRADETLRQTPILFFTAAVGKRRVAEHDGEIGGFPFLAKPADLQAVIECIEKQLTRNVDQTSACRAERVCHEGFSMPAYPGVQSRSPAIITADRSVCAEELR
jgi:DNA-binding response OmpR family regulator